MRYVIIRDDDTNALTPVECLERLYRPFLERGMPVNLAVIPNVATGTTTPGDGLEGYLSVLSGEDGGSSAAKRGSLTGVESLPIHSNPRLVRYLLDNPGYQLVQHGCRHDYFEFDRSSRPDLRARLEQGTRLFLEAGFPEPRTFVAPYDRISRAGFEEISRRFPVLSTGWFELGRLPRTWWPRYLAKKLRHAPHWQVNGTTLLSHPGCLLSCHRDYGSMVEGIVRSIQSRRLTVLVTHWWEYFRAGKPDETFISRLHETAEHLGARRDIKVITFDDLVSERVPLN